MVAQKDKQNCVCVCVCTLESIQRRFFFFLAGGQVSVFFSDYMNEAPPECTSCVRAIKTKPG